MIRLIQFLIVAVLISCGQNAGNKDELIKAKPAVPDDSISNSTATPEKESEKDTVENDCVFNDNYEELTKKWLSELKIDKFVWRADLSQALIPEGSDTVFISQGGCAHFGISVESKMTNNVHPITDSVFFIK